MKLQLKEIMEATISELDDIDMTLALRLRLSRDGFLETMMQAGYGRRRQ